MSTECIEIVRMRLNAMLPIKKSESSAGYDLFSAANEPTIIKGMCGREKIPTGIKISIPKGWYGRIAPRSGLAYELGIDVLAGVIDSDYRGEIEVILMNTGPDAVSIGAKTRIAQLIIERCASFPIVEKTTLVETSRGEGGFGSTGYI